MYQKTHPRYDQQEQHRQRQQVRHQSQHAEERVAQHHDAESAADRAECREKEEDLFEEHQEASSGTEFVGPVRSA